MKNVAIGAATITDTKMQRLDVIANDMNVPYYVILILFLKLNTFFYAGTLKLAQEALELLQSYPSGP